MITFLLSVSAQDSNSSADPTTTVTVTDANGAPLKEAFVESIELPDTLGSRLAATDANGTAVFNGRLESFIVRCAGYRSRWLRTKSATSSITLERFDGKFPICAPQTQCYTEDTRFCVPKRFSLKTTTWGDADYNGITYCLNHGPERSCIAHGFGPLWSFGIPIVGESADLDAFEEVVYAVGRISVVTSSGVQNKSPWRFFGILGETMEYKRVPSSGKSQLDEVMDAVCFRPDLGVR